MAPKEGPDEPFIYLDITSIDNSTFRIDTPKAYLGKDAPSRARQRVHTGNILFSTVRTYLKNIALVPPEYHGQVASTGFCVLNTGREIDSRFVFYFVQNDEFITRLNPIQRGTSYPAVRDADVLGQTIPLPPLAEQGRIVAEIETQFTRLDASVAALRRAQANLKRYRASVLKDACEGRLVPTEAELARSEGREYESAAVLLERILAERRARWESQEKRRGKYKEPSSAPDTSDLPELPEGWVWATVEQTILGTPQNGLYKHKSEYGDGIPILRIDDYQDFYLRERESLQCLKATPEGIGKVRPAAGSTGYNRVNSPSHLGKCLVVPDSLLPTVFESNMMRLATSSVISVSYIAYYLRSFVGGLDLLPMPNGLLIKQVSTKLMYAVPRSPSAVG